MNVERILFIMAAVLLTVFVCHLIIESKANVIPIFATLAWGVAMLGSLDTDNF